MFRDGLDVITRAVPVVCERAQAQLYVCWKRCCLEKEEVLVAARRRRLDGLHEMRLEYENEVIGLDSDRRRALGAVGDA
jgi:hypothetical protein